MTPYEFIAKWRASELKERSASQEHFIDLCRLLGEPSPAEADPTGEAYCFERGARKDTGGNGWADVWKRHHFAWEYKGKRADLDAAFGQLRAVRAGAGESAAADRLRHAAVPHPHQLDQLRQQDLRVWPRRPDRRGDTRQAPSGRFSDPERLRPGETRQSLTERAAASFATVAQALRERGHDPQAVAHFVNRLVFCMFADDVGPAAQSHVHADAGAGAANPRALRRPCRRSVPGDGSRRPGRLRDGRVVQRRTVRRRRDSAAEQSDIDAVLAASNLDWSEIDPSILGTLFERGTRPGQTRPARRALHRPRQDHADRRASGDPPVARRVGRGEGGDCR